MSIYLEPSAQVSSCSPVKSNFTIQLSHSSLSAYEIQVTPAFDSPVLSHSNTICLPLSKNLSQQALNSSEKKKKKVETKSHLSDIFIAKIKVFQRENHLTTRREAKSLESFYVCFFHSSLLFLPFEQWDRRRRRFSSTLFYVIQSSDSKLKQSKDCQRNKCTVSKLQAKQLYQMLRLSPVKVASRRDICVVSMLHQLILLSSSKWIYFYCVSFLLNSPNLIFQVSIEWKKMQ